jgi:hypothetical protein
VRRRYESDLDREEAEELERELEEERAREEELLRYPERRTFFSPERGGPGSSTWLQENEWMDDYRKVAWPLLPPLRSLTQA